MKPVAYPFLYALLGMSNMLHDRRYQGRRNRHHHARVAQLAERLFCKQRVAGSSPVSSSTILPYTILFEVAVLSYHDPHGASAKQPPGNPHGFVAGFSHGACSKPLY